MKICVFSIALFIVFLSQAKAECNTDVLVVLDGSSSVEGDFSVMRNFVKHISSLLNVGPTGHRVAFLEYSSKSREVKWPRKEFGDFKSNSQFQKFIDQLPYLKGLTHTGRALELAYEMLEKVRRDSTVILAVITDGFAGDPREVEAASAKIFSKYGKRPKFYVTCMAVPTKYNVEGMRMITGNDSTRIIFPPSVEEKAMKLLIPVLGGSDCGTLDTTVITTTPTTTTTTTEKPSTECEVDLLFLIDFSTSVDEVHKKFIEAAIKVLEGMTVSPFHTRVAMVKYAGKRTHEIVFHFKKHDTFEAVASEMRSAPYTGGTTWTGAGIRLALTEFNETYGARPGLAKKVVVVYTDGYSQEDPLPAAEEMRANDIEMYAVGLSHSEIEPDQQQLQDIAGDENNVFINKNEELAKRLAAYNRNCKG